MRPGFGRVGSELESIGLFPRIIISIARIIISIAR
jgi:hypothetical protein